uniref:Flap endonuclease n=1 Tax=Pithovirus LCDPAC01 TaxID=2506600 RepID=A0A481YMR1_9VIRU|nr:MAG: flap endonuclease [Pithovirus LCDPAC01]
MGIKGLNSFLRNKFSAGYIKKAFLKGLDGKRIAIDMNNLIAVFYSVSKRNVCKYTNLMKGPPSDEKIIKSSISYVVSRINTIIAHGIIPICCFDGKMSSDKKHAWAKRKKTNNTAKERLDNANEVLQSVDPFDQTTKMHDNYRKYFYQYFDRSLMREIVGKIKNVLKKMDIVALTPDSVTAPTVNPEAEALCAHLCINGLCYAAYSTDTDLHAYGVNICITKIEENEEREWITIFSESAAILKIIDMKYENFVDFCIMCGTDYNPNIPRVGPVTSYGLIKKYHTIEKVGECTSNDISILDHTVARKKFQSARVPATLMVMELLKRNVKITQSEQ